MKHLYIPLSALLIVSFATLQAVAQNKMDAAVADMKSYLKQDDFPFDMFERGQDKSDIIQVNTTWWAFEPGLAAAFKRHYPSQQEPTGVFWRDSFLSENENFEEAVMRAVWGEDHQHLLVEEVREVISQGTPPEIKPEFQDGARINFQKLAEHIQASLRENGYSSEIGTVTNSQCDVTTENSEPPQGLQAWYREHTRWAACIRVEQTSGENRTVTAGDVFFSTKSRIVLHGYVLVRLKGKFVATNERSRHPLEIGPIFENDFRKHGSDPLELKHEVVRLRAIEKAGHFHSKGIRMSDEFNAKGPLILMTSQTALPDFLAPLQLKVANSLLNDSSLQFKAASSVLPVNTESPNDGPIPAP